MTKHQAATPASRSLKNYADQSDDLFEQRNARGAFQRNLEGVLRPVERNNTLTDLVNGEPIVGIYAPRVQTLQRTPAAGLRRMHRYSGGKCGTRVPRWR